MNNSIRLALAQINCTVGDLEGNAAKIIAAANEAAKAGAHIVAFPEMAVTGYPPEDLLLKPAFIEDNKRALAAIAEACPSITAIVGFADSDEQGLYNAAAVIDDGAVAAVYHKMILPNYGVFDEKRYFREGENCPVFELNGILFGLNICEDIWHEEGPARLQASTGKASLIININASPYYMGKQGEREEILRKRIKENGLVIAYANLVGGQDELVFDGGSLIMDEKGDVIAQAPRFEESLLIADISLPVKPDLSSENFPENIDFCRLDSPPLREKCRIEAVLPPKPGRLEEIYSALLLGTRDYVIKSGFKKVIIGLSGGIDSALTAAVAVDALGPDAVMGVAMPSRYSSQGSIDDAKLLAKNMGIEFHLIAIESAFGAFLESLGPLFEGFQPDVTEENIQARVRGNLLMALSNKFGRMVLTTGNKSEVSVGYATLYGDMAGGFSVLKDLPKTLVYELARYRNEKSGFDIIPESTITKAPSAELRPDQTDQDSLPPYDVLDAILQKYVEEQHSLREIVDSGFDEETVMKVIGMVDRNEYKRRQAAPGVKITPRAFGRDRRMPIVNGYKGNVRRDEEAK